MTSETLIRKKRSPQVNRFLLVAYTTKGIPSPDIADSESEITLAYDIRAPKLDNKRNKIQQ